MVSLETGIISAFAGSYKDIDRDGYGDGGPATSARMRQPNGVWLDSNLNYAYLSDVACNNVRRVALNDGTKMKTYAGPSVDFGGKAKATGDDGPATSALLSGPTGVWGDTNNAYVYVADHTSYTIRRININSTIITSYVGTLNVQGQSVDGVVASSALLGAPFSMWGNTVGDLYLDGGNNYVVLRVDAVTTMVTRVAGMYGSLAYMGDGPALERSVSGGVAHIIGSTDGSLHISDRDNQRIRIIYNVTATNAPSLAPTPLPSEAPTEAPPPGPCSEGPF
eukprot:gene39301-48559_t